MGRCRYASVDYVPHEYQEADIVLVALRINKEVCGPRSFLRLRSAAVNCSLPPSSST